MVQKPVILYHILIRIGRLNNRWKQMLNESKPTLSDGTRIEDLINVQTREVSMRLLSDHEIYRLEMDRIFAKTWLLLGHETEIPNSGDFVVRDMGEDQVIVSRDRKGDVH